MLVKVEDAVCFVVYGGDGWILDSKWENYLMMEGPFVHHGKGEENGERLIEDLKSIFYIVDFNFVGIEQ